MAKIVGKIVLTGGPCAGKTTALSSLEKNLTEQGYKVLIVPESATELINGGIRAFGDGAVSLFDFQKLIINYQLYKERLYESAIKAIDDDVKCVIIYDRGVLDNKAYLSDELFDELLNCLSLNSLSLMDNYDLVIHLVTAADGKSECYTLDNNCARTEGIDEAVALDRKTLAAWSGHPNLKVIDNSTDFDLKIKRVLNEVNNLLGKPIMLKRQRKFIGNFDVSIFDLLGNYGATEIRIEQTYLSCGNDNYEKRLRKRSYNGQSTYYLTVQKKEGATSKVLFDKRIDESLYSSLLLSHESVGTVSKTRYSFVYDKQYYRIDVFDDSDLVLLEVDLTEDKKIFVLPPFLSEFEEVTGQKEYENICLANGKGKVMVK